MTIAASGHAPSTPHRTRLTKEPHFQPSFLARGLPSSTMLGVATHVLRKSAPRLSNSSIRKKKYCRLPTGTRSSIILFPRRLLGRLQPRLGHPERRPPVLHRAEETGFVSFMTGGTDLFDLDQQRVAVAVEGDFLDRLRVAAGFAFHPEFLARAAPEIGPAGFDGLFQRRPVHPGHHQDAAGGLFLNDRRDQPVRIEFQMFVKVHGAHSLGFPLRTAQEYFASPKNFSRPPRYIPPNERCWRPARRPPGPPAIPPPGVPACPPRRWPPLAPPPPRSRCG